MVETEKGDDATVAKGDGSTVESRRGRLGHLMHEHPVRVLLAAILVGAAVCAGVVGLFGGFDDAGKVQGDEVGDAAPTAAATPFSKSQAGDCLTWPAADPTQQSLVDCNTEHMFEVAGAVDTAVYPGVQFGDDAPWPGADQFATIRDEYCPTVVNTYLAGMLDPAGRFTVNLMFPAEEQWIDGERSLRCGLQQSGTTGTLRPFTGFVRDLDQAQQWPVGTCIGIDPATRKPTDPVDCSEPHAFQVTGVIDLGVKFGAAGTGQPWPNVDAQNEYLKTTCPGVTDQFLGGSDKLAQSTLNLQWSTLAETSWMAGSRTSVCYIGLPDEAGFATLVGDAKGDLLINGQVPVPPPAEPPGRIIPSPVPLPPGVEPNPIETPAPAGGGGG
ncbi:UNVERIFIED_CONTAM: putative regulator of septum formation [Williamsia faeni]